MKKILSSIFCLIIIMSVPVLAANASVKTNNYEITVNEHKLDTSNLPYSAYKEGNTVMIPLKEVAVLLGYKVTQRSKTNKIIIEDSIQKSVIHIKSKKVQFKGKLKVINLSKEIELDQKVVVHKKTTYIPLEFFQYFFNDTSIDGKNITIATQMSEIQ